MDSQALQAMVPGNLGANETTAILAAVVVGAVVLLAQTGFGLLATGMVRSKNAAHTMAMGFVVFTAAVLGYWLTGFALQHWSTAALRNFLFDPGADRALVPSFLMGAVAAAIVSTIPTGGVAERARLPALAVLALATSAVIYPVYASWVHSGGWLAGLGKHGLGHGVVDVGGSSFVHMLGGTLALLAARSFGPRLGKYGIRGEVRPIPAHNMPIVVVGTLVLAAALFVFDTAAAGLAGNGQALVMICNAILSAAAGGAAAFVHTRLRFGKPDLSMMCNGLLAATVAISAGGPFVGGLEAILVGIVASLVAIEGALFVERRLKIDDPIGAFSVHGLGGAWGLVALGLFANGRAGVGLNGVDGPVRGLLHGGASQLAASLVGVAVGLAWLVPLGALLLALVGRLMGARVSADDEVAGLDVPELGMPGYVTEAIHAGGARSSDLGRAGTRPAPRGA